MRDVFRQQQRLTAWSVGEAKTSGRGPVGTEVAQQPMPQGQSVEVVLRTLPRSRMREACPCTHRQLVNRLPDT